MCRVATCPKNRVVHQYVNDTPSASFQFIHHKTERNSGQIVIHLVPEMVEAFSIFEQAAQYEAPECPSLVFTDGGLTYADAYFSLHFNSVLVGLVGKHTNINLQRHQFITLWSKYILEPDFKDAKADEISEAVAYMMGNSLAAWIHYDDNRKVGAINMALGHMPKFREFVRKQQEVEQATR
jgi:hypothetical protein